VGGVRPQGAGGDEPRQRRLEPRGLAAGSRLLPGETLEQVLAGYDEVARRTDELVRTVDLDASQPLPVAPWFERGKGWTAQRVLMHIVTETGQHAGHADIIRESIDGQKSMR
jgi:hypothetical protein